MNALDYVKQIRLAPNGELLAASEKLALILLAMGEGEEDGATCPSIDELAEHCLLSRRSMFRVLSQLEIKGAIRSLLRYNSKGQQIPTFYYLLDSKGRVLPVTPSQAEDTHKGLVESVIEGGEGVTGDTPGGVMGDTLPVTDDTLPDSSNPSRESSLRATPGTAPRGMGFAPPSPPLNTIKKNIGGGVLNPACAVWLEVFGQTLDEAGAEMIAEKVTNIAAWRDTLKGWKASSWSARNIDGQIERYGKKLKSGDYNQPAPDPLPAPPTVVDLEEEAKYRSYAYGDDETTH